VRKLPLVLLIAVLAGCGGTRTIVKTVTVERTSASGYQQFFGEIKSLELQGNGYLLRFDPVWFTSGITANVAQAEDQGNKCRPKACPPVDNDNYRIDEGHRLLTFLVPAGVRGTVLVKTGSHGGPFPAKRITAAELARVLAGQSSVKLFEPLSSGVWIVVHIDTVRTFAQQYQP
jgi:hypothetical protein